MFFKNDRLTFYYRFTWGVYSVKMTKFDAKSKVKMTSIDVSKQDFEKMKATMISNGWVECEKPV